MGCAHAAKLLEYWQNRQILENLEPSNTFKAKAILKKKKKKLSWFFTICLRVLFWSKFVTLAYGRLFPNPSLVLSRGKEQKQGLRSIVSELAITEVLLRPKSLSHKFLSTSPTAGQESQ